MLVELRVRDYAVVEDLSLELEHGLNVLTGETGADRRRSPITPAW